MECLLYEQQAREQYRYKAPFTAWQLRWMLLCDHDVATGGAALSVSTAHCMRAQ